MLTRPSSLVVMHRDDDDEGMQEVPEGQSLEAFQADLLSDSK